MENRGLLLKQQILDASQRLDLDEESGPLLYTIDLGDSLARLLKGNGPKTIPLTDEKLILAALSMDHEKTYVSSLLGKAVVLSYDSSKDPILIEIQIDKLLNSDDQTLAYIANNQGELVFSSDSTITPENLNKRELVQFFIRNDLEQGYHTYFDPNQDEIIGIFQFVSGTNLIFFSEQKKAIVLADISSFNLYYAIVVIIFAIIAVIIARYPLRRLQVIFEETHQAAKKIAEGQFKVDLPESFFRETSILADGFHEMADQLDERDQRINKFIDEQKNTQHQLTLAVEERTKELKREVQESQKAKEFALATKNIAQQQASEIRAIMETIQMVICYITDNKGSISKTRSEYFDLFFKTNSDNCSILDLLEAFLDSNTLQSFKEFVNVAVNDDQLNFFANEGMLPNRVKTIHPHFRFIEFSFFPIIEDGLVEKLLIKIQDVTNIEELKIEEKHRNQGVAVLNEIVQTRADSVAFFFRDANDLIERIKINCNRLVALENSELLECVRLIYGAAHTIKGMARTLKFMELSQTIHNFEDIFYELKNSKMLTEKQVSKKHLPLSDILESQNILEQVFDRYLKQYRDIQTAWGGANQTQNISNVKTSLHSNIYQIVSENLSIAKQLDKELPRVSILMDRDFLISHDARRLLVQIFVHLVRNALDHGIEKPDVRKETDKDPKGTISVELVSEIKANKDLHLSFKFFDDGPGLKLSKIFEAALKKGLVQEGKRISPSEIAHLIFHEGFSTQEIVSDVSGRGVGVREVSDLVSSRGGSISLVCRHFPNWDEAVNKRGDTSHIQFYFDFDIFLESENWQLLVS